MKYPNFFAKGQWRLIETKRRPAYLASDSPLPSREGTHLLPGTPKLDNISIQEAVCPQNNTGGFKPKRLLGSRWGIGKGLQLNLQVRFLQQSNLFWTRSSYPTSLNNPTLRTRGIDQSIIDKNFNPCTSQIWTIEGAWLRSVRYCSIRDRFKTSSQRLIRLSSTLPFIIASWLPIAQSKTVLTMNKITLWFLLWLGKKNNLQS